MDSYRFYLGARGFYGICWTCMVTVNMVFMVEVAGLDPLQMVLVGTVLEGWLFLFEIPTGVVADAVSRRLSVIIGHVMIGVGFLVLASELCAHLVVSSNLGCRLDFHQWRLRCVAE